MLSAQRIRDILGEPNLSDAEALAFRDACRKWVEFAFEAWEALGYPSEGELERGGNIIREEKLDTGTGPWDTEHK